MVLGISSNTLILSVESSVEVFLLTKGKGRQLTRFPVCFPVYQTYFEKGSALKGQNLLPLRADSFLLKTPLFRPEENPFDRDERESIPLKLKLYF